MALPGAFVALVIPDGVAAGGVNVPVVGVHQADILPFGKLVGAVGAVEEAMTKFVENEAFALVGVSSFPAIAVVVEGDAGRFSGL